MGKETKEQILLETTLFYDQYLYVKDVMRVFLDADAAEKNQNKSKNFFMISASACIDSYSMTLSRMYEKDSKSKTIYSLINKCKNNKDLFEKPDEMMEYLTTFNRNLKQDEYLKNAINILSHRRNKIFAHNDKECFIEYPTEFSDGTKNHVPLFQLWMLIKVTGELLQKISHELGCDIENLMSVKYDGDLTDLIDMEHLRRDTLLDL